MLISKLRQLAVNNESFSLQFFFGVITESPAASYNRHLAEKYKIAMHILQLHRTKKQPDEDPMKKGARDGKAAASYNQHLAEKYKIAIHILQLHRIKKQPDEDSMKKGARDGKAAACPDLNRGAVAFALKFTLVTFFVSRQRK